MLKKILSFLLDSSEEKLEKITLKVKEAERIAKEKFEDHVSKKVIPMLSEKIKEITETLKEIEEKCKELENAQLRNPDIPLKEKQFMEGNRESYVKHARILVEQVVVPKTHEEIDIAYKQLQESLNYFGEHTVRAIQILNHFFEHETAAIHKKVGELNRKYSELKQIVDEEEFKAHSGIQEGIKKMHDAKSTKASLKKEIKDLEESITAAKKEIEKLEKHILSIESSEEHKRLKELKSRKEKIDSGIKEINNEIITTFSMLERSLRMYERGAMDNADWVRNYLDNPTAAFANDTKNIIDSILLGLKEKISSRTIDLKNNDKITGAIDRMLKEGYMQKTRRTLEMMKNELVKVIDEAEKIDTENEINDAKVKIDAEHSKLKDHGRILEETKEKISKISLEDIKEEIEKNISRILGKEVEIEE